MSDATQTTTVFWVAFLYKPLWRITLPLSEWNHSIFGCWEVHPPYPLTLIREGFDWIMVAHITPPKTNIDTQNDGLQKVIYPFQIWQFSISMLVFRGVALFDAMKESWLDSETFSCESSVHNKNSTKPTPAWPQLSSCLENPVHNLKS